MKYPFLLLFITLLLPNKCLSQIDGFKPSLKTYLGISYGTSRAIGDFSDDNVENENAGFAKDGIKFDFYGGRFLTDDWLLTFVYRYQRFETKVDELLIAQQLNNPSLRLTSDTSPWHVHYLFVGTAYRLHLGKKFFLFPRVGIGPMLVRNPEISFEGINNGNEVFYNQSSETSIGLGYEFGIGLRRNISRHIALMPTYTITGGLINLRNVTTTTSTNESIRDFAPSFLSFNLGLSIAIRFK